LKKKKKSGKSKKHYSLLKNTELKTDMSNTKIKASSFKIRKVSVSGDVQYCIEFHHRDAKLYVDILKYIGERKVSGLHLHNPNFKSNCLTTLDEATSVLQEIKLGGISKETEHKQPSDSNLKNSNLPLSQELYDDKIREMNAMADELLKAQTATSQYLTSKPNISTYHSNSFPGSSPSYEYKSDFETFVDGWKDIGSSIKNRLFEKWSKFTKWLDDDKLVSKEVNERTEESKVAD
jgi:hypothetical protein